MKLIHIFIAFLCCYFFSSCNQEEVQEKSNTERFEIMKEEHGFASEDFELEIDNNQKIPESEWNKLNEQLIQIKKGQNFRLQRKLYTSLAKPFIRQVGPRSGILTPEAKDKMVELSRSLGYNKTGKSIKEILRIADENPNFFPPELVEEFRTDIENGVVKDIEFTPSEIEYINSASQN